MHMLDLITSSQRKNSGDFCHDLWVLHLVISCFILEVVILYFSLPVFVCFPYFLFAGKPKTSLTFWFVVLVLHSLFFLGFFMEAIFCLVLFSFYSFIPYLSIYVFHVLKQI